MRINPKRTKADGVGRDAMVANPSNHSLNGAEPLTLNVHVSVNAGRDLCPLEAFDPRARASVSIKWRVMPQHVEAFIGFATQFDSLLEGAIKRFHLTIDRGLAVGRGRVGRDRRSCCPANDEAMRDYSITAHGQQRRPEHGTYRLDAVPPRVVVALSEDLRTWQPIEPGQVELEVSVVPGHRDVARYENKVARANDITPVLFDLHGVVAPTRGVALAPVGASERQMQIRNSPDIHRKQITSNPAHDQTANRPAPSSTNIH